MRRMLLLLLSASIAIPASAGVFSPGSKPKLRRKQIVASHMSPEGYVTVSGPAGTVTGDHPIQVTATVEETRASATGTVGADGSFIIRLPANPKDLIMLTFTGCYGKARTADVTVARTAPSEIPTPSPPPVQSSAAPTISMAPAPRYADAEEQQKIWLEYMEMREQADKVSRDDSSGVSFMQMEQQAREHLAAKHRISKEQMDDITRMMNKRTSPVESAPKPKVEEGQGAGEQAAKHGLSDEKVEPASTQLVDFFEIPTGAAVGQSAQGQKLSGKGIISSYEGKSKAAIKKAFGPPDLVMGPGWYYHHLQIHDEDSGKIMNSMMILFVNDRAEQISFMEMPSELIP